MTLVEGRTLLQHASASGNLEIVKFLVDEGAIVNSQLSKEERFSALHFAIRSRNSEIARYLIKQGAKINRWPQTPANSLLELCADDSLYWSPPLSTQEFFSFLLDEGAELMKPEASPYSPYSPVRFWGASLAYLIMNKVKLGDDFIRHIIEAGADVHYPNTDHYNLYALSPLQAAAYRINLVIAQQLVKHGARINDPPASEKGRTALQALYATGNELEREQMVRFLVENGADVNAPAARNQGITALQGAVNSGNIESVNLLLDKGADVDIPGAATGGRTALQAACENLSENSRHQSNIDIVRLLVDSGADINVPAAYEEGITALQGVAASGNIECVLLLLETGADVDAPGAVMEGRTALEIAAEHGRLDVVQILVNAYRARGLEPDCHSARELAMEENHLGVVELLESVMSAQGHNVSPLPTFGS